VVDLTDAYNVGRVQRKIELIGSRSLKITDDIQVKSPHQIAWNMLTQANVEVKGQLAVLISKRSHHIGTNSFSNRRSVSNPTRLRAAPRGAIVSAEASCRGSSFNENTQIIVELGTSDRP